MEPRIQYAKTSDGVNIACAAFGEGPPLVYIGSAPAGVHFYSHFPYASGATDRLVASGWQVIRYDGRGTGSSDREALDCSLEARLRDLEAVVDRLELKHFALCGHLGGAPVAVAYAVQQPKRVSRLVLWEPIASGAEYTRASAERRILNAMRPLFEEHWELMTLNIAHLNFGFTDNEVANQMAAALRSGISAAAYRALDEASEIIDVTELLERVRAPTLVASGTGIFGTRNELPTLAKKVAAAVPNARLVTASDVTGAIDEFLREGEPLPSVRAEPTSGTAVILFADIADSTGLTERMGDAAFREKARELDGALRAAMRERGGTPVEGKLLGDGVLAVFTSAREAIEAALACGEAGRHAGLPLHLGIHAGDVIREKDPDGRDNVYGGAVNIASRIAGLSAAGEVLVSETVRSLARTSAGVEFEDRGEQELKGVGEKVRVWAVVSQRMESG
jgi:class 3 adenylate cyclase